MKHQFIINLLTTIFLLLSCHEHEHHDGGHSHSAHGHEGAQHDHDINNQNFVLRTDSIELFVDYRPLIAGEESQFIAHYTDMNGYKAIQDGKSTMTLQVKNKAISPESIGSDASPGIYIHKINPNQLGTSELVFTLESHRGIDTFILRNIQVYPNRGDARAASEQIASGDAITFTKEQVWNTEFSMARVEKDAISDLIHTSGEIQAAQGEEKMLSSNISGIVHFYDNNLRDGSEVKSGKSLFSVKSENLVENNLNERLQVAEAREAQAKADYDRAVVLMKDKIIGEKEHEKRKADFKVAQAELQTLKKGVKSGGQSISAPIKGIVKELLVTEGQFVEAGRPLVRITNNRRLLIRADISQKHLHMLPRIQSAQFRAPYHKEFHPIEAYNGKIVSYSKALSANQKFIPLYIEIDNLKNLIPGSYVELYLKAPSNRTALVIPKKALLQDYGSYYVYVQTGGETYEKRYVELAEDDGTKVAISSGLAEGEWVVTEGVYKVKMASMSNSIPAHGHSH